MGFLDPNIFDPDDPAAADEEGDHQRREDRSSWSRRLLEKIVLKIVFFVFCIRDHRVDPSGSIRGEVARG